MKLDILVLSAHPDDAELGCGGTIAKQIALGYKVGIVDLTQGELGTRGTVVTRMEEAAEAAKIFRVSVRDNLKLRDAFFQNDQAHQLKVIQAIRSYQPEVILTNAIYDRHTDHGKAASLVADAAFLSGLMKIETLDSSGKPQAPWRPRVVYHYIQSQLIQPDLIVDISGYWDIKLEAIKAFKTQFYDPSSKEPETYISTPAFLQMIESRALEFGHAIGKRHGEGFTVKRIPGVNNLMELI